MFELLFLLSFTLHNLEEALWLPKWSAYAKKFHKEVSYQEFHFAVLIITIFGYILTFLSLAFGKEIAVIRYSYLGFVLMMCFNALFPHLAATIILRKYSPGTLTGLLLNLPIGLYLIFKINGIKIYDYRLLVSFVLIAGITLLSLKPLFRLGNKLLGDVKDKE